MTTELRERLRELRLFRELEDEGLEKLLRFARVSEFRKKTVLFTEGESYAGAWVVLSGLAVVYKLSEDGRMLILRVCRPGTSLGENSLFESRDAVYGAHARTTRDSTLLFLPRERFLPFLKQHPEVAWQMLVEFGERIREMGTALEGVAFREVTSRLARYLLREIETAGVAREEEPSVELPLAKGSLASYLGAAHETLSRTFQRLHRQGIVRVDGPRVTVLDVERLKRLV